MINLPDNINAAYLGDTLVDRLYRGDDLVYARNFSPQNFQETADTRSSITMGWDAVHGADRYEIRWGTLLTITALWVEAGDVTSYLVSGLSSSTTYYFELRALVGTFASAIVAATGRTEATVQPRVGNFSATVGHSGGPLTFGVRITWTASRNATSYRVSIGGFSGTFTGAGSHGPSRIYNAGATVSGSVRASASGYRSRTKTDSHTLPDAPD